MGARDISGITLKNPDDMTCEVFLDFPVSWHRLRHFCDRIMIPVVLSAVTNQNTADAFQFFD